MNKNFYKRTILLSTALASLGIANAYIFNKTEVLPDILEGDVNYFFSHFGNIYYVEKGSGEPLLLIHGLASGVSSFMWRKNFDELSKNHRVYAIDMPGFGKSQKLPITYTSKVYRDVIKGFITNITGYPVNIITDSQSAAYVIRLEKENPGLVKKLIAICPTGVFELSKEPSSSKKMVTELFKLPIVGTSMYNLLVSKPGIKYFIGRQTYYNKDLATKYVLEHYTRSSRQNRSLSKYAPASFLGGHLNENITNELHEIDIPMLVVWGKNAKMNSVKNLDSFKDLKPNIEHYVFDKCGFLPQEEYAVEFNTLCDEFLKK